jgi:hypothetical protein
MTGNIEYTKIVNKVAVEQEISRPNARTFINTADTTIG